MTASPHRIRRQRWVLHTTTAAQALALRRQLRADWAERLQTAFDQAFNAADRPGVTLHIPKMELRIRLPAGEKGLDQLPELLERQLAQHLCHALPVERAPDDKVTVTSAPTAQSDFETLLGYLRSGLLSWELAGAAARPAEVLSAIVREQPADLQTWLRHHPESTAFYFRLWQLLEMSPAAAESASPATAAATQFAALLTYLRTGQSPWTWPGPEPRPLVEFRETCRQQWARIVDHLRQNAEPAPFYARLWQILDMEPPPTQVDFLTQSLPAPWQAMARSLLLYLLSAGDELLPTVVRRALASAFAVELFQSLPLISVPGAVSETPVWPWPGLAALVAVNLSAAQQYALQAHLARQRLALPPGFEFLAVRPEASAIPPVAPAWAPADFAPPPVNAGPNPVGSAVDCPQEKAPAPANEHGVRISATVVGPASHAGTQNAALTRSTAGNAPMPLRVFLAGLVLLHPYIARFLTARNLPWEPAKNFTDSELARAAALLHYLATGGENLQEYELNFVKVLLGLTPETPLCVGPGWVTAGDRAEAQALLESVIEHWTALKNTTPDGLRGTFLLRPGWLRQDANGWRLHLERTPFDVLLDRLPWAMSVVKLPWMKHPLHVEW